MFLTMWASPRAASTSSEHGGWIPLVNNPKDRKMETIS